MKIHALRIEPAQSIIGHLASGQISDVDLEAVLSTFVVNLVAALESYSQEPVKVELYHFKAMETAKAKLLKPGLRYICLDSQGSLGLPFGVSRQFDFVTREYMGITARPGFNDLDKQISDLKAHHGTTFGIIEDDIFTGGTLRGLIEKFAERGIVIEDIACGISSTHAIAGKPVRAVVYYDKEHLFELTDPRDYIVGAKNGGLVVTYLSAKARVPYDEAFVDMTARSSIDPASVTAFTQAVRGANYRLHEKLGSLELPATTFYPASILQEAGFAKQATIKDILDSTAPVA